MKKQLFKYPVKFTIFKTTFDINKKKKHCCCKITGRVKYSDGSYSEDAIDFFGNSWCNREDKFDSFTGKHLAESRAKREINTYMLDLIKTYNQNLNSFKTTLEAIEDKFRFLTNREKEHIKNIAK